MVLVVAMMFAFGCERKIVNESEGTLAADATACFACHGDQDRSLVVAEMQWMVSKHASGDNTDRNRLNSSFYGACERCHTAEGFLASLEGESASGEHFSAIGCFTCHAPHSSGDLSVRVTDAVMLMNSFSYDKGSSNLCASCHQSRANIDEYIVGDTELDLRWGPHHSNHADMLAGTNAYEYADFDYDNSAHTNATVNGCVDCHMSDAADVTLGGHSWMMEDAKDHINKTGCNTSNCHNGDVSTFDLMADEDYDWDGTTEGVQSEIEGLLDSLETLLVDAGLLDDAHPTDVTVSADSAGAVFNWLFVYEDRSLGVHNTEYATDLLQTAINFIVHGDPEGTAQGTNRSKMLTSRD